ncbi:hypothetical protein ABID19_006855 [Mesorhizobium robiniae]|uniref:AAA+ ATPase domain-containing protein n=1 Tax=Mesorhizobium robiniae TaxID=559315 RepID=A0ABV2GZT3_9HYPH
MADHTLCKYQLTVAKLPIAKDIDEFDFDGTPVNEVLVRGLANGIFVADQRNAVLIGGIGTGKSHLAIAIARALIRNGSRGRFFNVVDLVNRLETEHRGGKQGRIADYLTRLDFVVLDELGYLPFAQAGGQLLFHQRKCSTSESRTKATGVRLLVVHAFRMTRWLLVSLEACLLCKLPWSTRLCRSLGWRWPTCSIWKRAGSYAISARRRSRSA